MPAFNECGVAHDPIESLPSRTELYPTQIDLSNTQQPHQDRLDHITGLPPEMIVLAILATVLALARRLPAVGRRRAVHAASRLAAYIAVAAAVLVFAGWAVLAVAARLGADGQHERQIAVLRVASPAFRLVSWVDRWEANPAPLMAEAAAFTGIREGLAAGDAAAALRFVDWPAASTPETRKARAAVLLKVAANHLAADRTTDAIDAAVAASQADSSSAAAFDSVSIARLHRVVELVEDEDFDQAHAVFREIAPDWRPAIHALLAAHLAGTQASVFMTAEMPKVDEALAVLEQAWKHARGLRESPAPLACDLAEVLQIRTAQAIRAEDGVLGTQLLMRSDALVPDSPVARELWVAVLYYRSLQESAQGQDEKAVQTLEDAVRRSADNTAPEIVDALAEALGKATITQSNRHDYGDALTSARRAHSLRPSDTTDSLIERVRLAKGEWALLTCDRSEAQREFEVLRAGKYHARTADMRLRHMPEASARLARIRQASRLESLPATCGELPVDLTGDGVVDEYQYSDSTGTIIGYTPVSDPGEVTFTSPEDSRLVRIVARDSDRNGRFDEVITRQGTAFVLTKDVDDDARPDLRLHIANGVVTREEALSGRIAMRVASAAIAARNQGLFEGAPDVYLLTFKNGEQLRRSRTVTSRFPTWQEGVVIDYRHRDEVVVQVWDEDIHWHDFLGAVRWDTLPVTDFVTTGDGQAVLEVLVTPSTKPEGFAFVAPSPRANPFTQGPIGVPAVDRIVADAKRLDSQQAMYMAFAQMAATELAVMTLVPRASWPVQMAAALALDLTVMNKIFAPAPAEGGAFQ
jgi:hypothetical protein